MRKRYFVTVETENEKNTILMFKNKDDVKKFLNGEVSHIDLDETKENVVTGVYISNEVIFGKIEDCTKDFDCWMGG